MYVVKSWGGHHVIQDLYAQRGANEQALALPELAVGGDQAGAQDRQERVEAEVEVLHVGALPCLRHPRKLSYVCCSDLAFAGTPANFSQ